MNKFLKYSVVVAGIVCGFSGAVKASFDANAPVFDRVKYKKNMDDVGHSIGIAVKESREIHVVLGSLPGEEHFAKLLLEEQEKEAQDQSKSFKQPVRIFFSTDVVQGSASPLCPILNQDFNDESIWRNIRDLLKETINPTGKSADFKGGLDKIYFDWSTVKFANWNITHLLAIKQALKDTGGIFIPCANLASQAVFKNNQTALAVYSKCEKEQKRLIPYNENFAPEKYDSRFLTGLSMASTYVVDGVTYVYNGTSLVYDVNFDGKDMSGRFKKIIGPLKFEKILDDSQYPDIGMQYRPSDFPEKNIGSFIKITSVKK